MKSSQYNLIFEYEDENEDEILLFNTLSASIIEIDAELKERMESNDFSGIDESILKELQRIGIVVEDALDERAFYSYIYQRERMRRNALFFTVIPTYSCNLTCSYCYQGPHELSSQPHHTAPAVARFINTMIGEETQSVQVGFIGGEPLLNKEMILTLLDSIRFNNPLDVAVTTNGTLMDEEFLHALLEKNISLQCELTLDGDRDVHDSIRVKKNGKGTFDEIMETVDLLKTHKVFTRLRVHINEKSIPSLDSLLERLSHIVNEHMEVYAAPLRSFSHRNQCHDFIEKYAGNQITLTRMVEEKFKKAGITNTERLLPRFFHCGAVTQSHYVIDYLGDVYKCFVVAGDKRFRVFTLQDENPSPVFYDFMGFDPLRIDKCRTCAMLPLCGGGCLVSKEKECSYDREKIKAMVDIRYRNK